jgi:hypothetical protein
LFCTPSFSYLSSLHLPYTFTISLHEFENWVSQFPLGIVEESLRRKKEGKKE